MAQYSLMPSKFYFLIIKKLFQIYFYGSWHIKIICNHYWLRATVSGVFFQVTDHPHSASDLQTLS